MGPQIVLVCLLGLNGIEISEPRFGGIEGIENVESMVEKEYVTHCVAVLVFLKYLCFTHGDTRWPEIANLLRPVLKVTPLGRAVHFAPPRHRSRPWLRV